MKYILLICIQVFASAGLYAQYRITLAVKNTEKMQALPGATAFIKSVKSAATADSNGIVSFNNLPAGTYSIIISHAGLEEKKITIDLPQQTDSIEVVTLDPGEEEEEVIITATRISRSISDIPTRVETISGEELAEKGNMKPGEIRMLLSESTGIQTQQTSATSYNSSIRIQGLDGRYTQILKDGFPLYAGFSGGLSLMQVAPLDLKQIEVIKGSSSTLYGGGAIAGLVNLVSKTPTSKRELSFIANATSAGGLDLSGFYSQRFRNTGLTIFSSRNTSRAYDPADIGFTAIPEYQRYTINPRLFLYGKKTVADIGFSYITEKRTGGSIDYIEKGKPGYFELNNTHRFTTVARIGHALSKTAKLEFKNSYSRFYRSIRVPDYIFKGIQQSTFSEFTFNKELKKTHWIAGMNLLTDDFAEEQQSPDNLRNYHFNTAGVFVQNNWNVSDKFIIESGLRADHVNRYGWAILPRVSAMFKLKSAFTLRVGGGSGYKTPTLFNEDAEKLHFRNIRSVDPLTSINERSSGGNFDINYRFGIGEVRLMINQLFFYTKLNDPLILIPVTNGYGFVNANGHIDTKGMETNLRLSYKDLKLFVGYTYADVSSHFNDIKSWFPLTARHRLNNVLMYEKEEKLKIGLEAYYFSRQKLNDGSIGRDYWTFGFMVEKVWEQFSIFVNFENFTDTRQTKFDSIYTGNPQNPVFKDIYAPVDGFVINGGLKIRL